MKRLLILGMLVSSVALAQMPPMPVGPCGFIPCPLPLPVGPCGYVACPPPFPAPIPVAPPAPAPAAPAQ